MSDKKNKIDFQDLMLYRIHEILLVASPYDAFILEQDGKLTEQILTEYLGLNLSYAPRVWNAPTAKKANQMLEKRFFDIIIVMMRISDMNPIQFSQKIKEQFPRKPIVLLAFDQSEIKNIPQINQKIFDEIFIWTGNANVFPAIIKSIEDKRNIKSDINTADVRTILFIEDTPKYYSSILPVLYREIIQNTKKLIDNSLNNSQKILHMRARPKIILIKNYSEAIKYIKLYRYNILGIVSDLKFPHKNKSDDFAGIQLIEHLKKINSAIPLIFQTTEKNIDFINQKYGIKVLNKNSNQLFKNLKEFMFNNLGFGNFKFRLPDNTVIKEITTIKKLAKYIKSAPLESLEYHASKNHLSNWLSVRGEFELASKFRKLKTNDFSTIEERKKYHVKLLENVKFHTEETIIVEYSSTSNDLNHNFIQIGQGSLGGKARGLAFANALLLNKELVNKFPKVRIKIPKIIAISTDEFDDFMDSNKLWEIATGDFSNKHILNKFLDVKLPKTLVKKLSKIISNAKYPLAIRSSSLLEDSQYQPLAGMYSTFMLANSHSKKEERLSQLCEAIKRVYASTFFRESQSLTNIPIRRLEEEKMGIIIMELAGQKHGNLFYPTFSGVAQSYNYYPVSYMKRKEGVVFTALGLGKTIVDGETSLRFSPKYPDILPQYYSTKSILNNSQNKFYALNMKNGENTMNYGETKNLEKFDLSIAENDGVLKHVASVITQDNILRDSLKYQGTRVITFSNIIKYELFPLNDIILELMKIGEKSLGCPVEMEFAVNINDKKEIDEFFLLQIKPMVIGDSNENINIKNYKDDDSLICFSNQVLGDGSINNISNIILVDPKTFKLNKTEEIAKEIGKINKKIGHKESYLLLGPGRWGSTDPWLGIPINWEQISNAKAIIEIGIDDLNPDPSFGSHFFQNISNLRIGYFTISKKNHKKFINWDLIENLEINNQTKYLKHFALEEPLFIKIDGKKGMGAILKNKPSNLDKMNEEESTGI